MKPTRTDLLNITQDRTLFEKISAAKTLIVSAFSEVGNQLATTDLKEVHTLERGIKISKGNELRQCPYQVLDIIRDFDLQTGLNIRILYWWGRGMYLFVFIGRDHPALNKFLTEKSRLNDYSVCQTDRWDYSGIIDHRKTQNIQSIQLEEHLRVFSHLQLIKPIHLPENESISAMILMEIMACLALLESLAKK